MVTLASNHPEPDSNALDKGLKRWCSKPRPKTIPLTINLKLITGSRWRENALLEGHRIVTQIQHEVLVELQEQPEGYKEGRAFDIITTALCAQRDQKNGKTIHRIGDLLSKHFKNRFDSEAYPVTSLLKLGAYRQCALPMLIWYYDVTKYIAAHNSSFVSFLTNKDQPNEIPTALNIYNEWVAGYNAYTQAQSVTIPFGYHREKRLDQVKKRDLRRLKKQLPPQKIVEQTLAHIDVLLNREYALPSAIEEAKRARHPWKTRQQQQRRLQASYHRQNPSPHQGRRKATLGLLSDAELERLQLNLQELQAFAEIFNDIRDALDLYLGPTLPRFPSVNDCFITPAQAEAYKRRYEAALEWFTSPFAQHTRQSSKDSDHLYRLEQDAIKRLDEEGHFHDQPSLQPLRYPRTMRGNSGTSFALLYNPDQQRYVLALKVDPHGYANSPPSSSQNNLVFFNAPYTRFKQRSSPSRPKTTLLFALEHSLDYHHKQMLQPVMKIQAEEQIQDYILQAWQVKTKPITTLQKTIPASAVGELVLTHHINPRKQHEFYAHMTLPIPVPPLQALPHTIVGIHERDGQYYYLVLNMKTREVLKYGEIVLPEHLLPKPGDRSYSDNFVFEMANAIVSIACDCNGLLGLEDTLWKRKDIGSRVKNRLNFSLPRERIMDTVRYKAFLNGLAAPCIVFGVSPSQDCSICGYRPRKNDQRLSLCIRNIFTCGSCGLRMEAPQNTATVVVKQALQVLVEKPEEAK